MATALTGALLQLLAHSSSSTVGTVAHLNAACCGAVAYADCWGFTAGQAATTSIQSALDCQAAHTVVVRNMGSPWIVTPDTVVIPRADKPPGARAALNFSSNQLVIFKAGTVIEAKRWDFHGEGDSLGWVGLQNEWVHASTKYSGGGPVRNLTIRGEEGAVWRMWKADYQTSCPKGSPEPAANSSAKCYSPSGQRHGLVIWSGVGITVSGLTIENTGGDGIETGGLERAGDTSLRTREVWLKDLVLRDNNRQGMSVISALGLLVEDTIFSRTNGTDPSAGDHFAYYYPCYSVFARSSVSATATASEWM